MAVDERYKEHWDKFMQVGLVSLDIITNLMISNKLPPKQVVFFLWMASYAWETKEGRHKVTFPVSTMAAMFDVSVSTLRSWLRNLEEQELINKVYLVRNIKTNKSKTYESYKAAYHAWNEKKGYHIAHLQVEILVDDIVVNLTGRQFKTRLDDDYDEDMLTQ